MRFNGRCRRAASTELALDLGVFVPWVPSKNNPADAPSSVFGIRGAREDSILPAQEIQIPRPIGVTCNRPAVLLHICSGLRRLSDFHEHAVVYGRDCGIEILVISFDPVVDATKNLLDDDQFDEMKKIADDPDTYGSLAGPPCSTFSRGRHRYVPGGPRPLRIRSNPLEPKAGLTDWEKLQCDIGTALLLRALILLSIVGCRGGWCCLEHPEDPGREPFPSIWVSWAVEIFKAMTLASLHLFDQCRFGAPSVKPTCLCSNDDLSGLALRCDHGKGAHVGLQGRTADGGWRTTAAAAYPSALNIFLAQRAVDAIVRARKLGHMPFARHAFCEEKYRHRVLAQCSRFVHGRKVLGGGVRFQA